MSNIIKYIHNSKKGLEREKNQDRILMMEQDNFYLFAIFDGVSSLPYSYLFANTFIRKVRSKIGMIDQKGNNLDRLFYEVNEDVIKLNIDGKTTVSVLFYSKVHDIVKYINIGDTRIYVFTNQFLEKITVDDSLIGRENVITRCLGSNSLNIEDFKTNSVENYYNYLICTDGFYKLMEENLKEYFNTFNFKNVTNIKKKICSLQRGKNQDDSTYILLKNEISSRD